MKLHPSIIIDTRRGVPPTKSKLYRKIAWIVRDAEYRCMKAVEEELKLQAQIGIIDTTSSRLASEQP